MWYRIRALMIIAIPEQERVLFTPMGVFPAPPPYWGVTTWWHWSCTDCGAVSKPIALFSHPDGALERGHNYHLAREQCDVVGQLALFQIQRVERDA